MERIKMKKKKQQNKRNETTEYKITALRIFNTGRQHIIKNFRMQCETKSNTPCEERYKSAQSETNQPTNQKRKREEITKKIEEKRKQIKQELNKWTFFF